MTHTERLRYSRYERLHFRLLGRWPEAVVQRRLRAADLDRKALETRELFWPTKGGT